MMADKRDIWLDEMTTKQQNIFRNLCNQIDRHLSRQSSGQGYRGSERYRAGAKAFARHLVVQYNGRSFKNITKKHLASFVKESKRVGITDKSLKTELAAVRKMHRIQAENAGKQPNKGVMEGKNHELGIERVQKREFPDKATRPSETQAAIDLARSMGRVEIAHAIEITRETGTRIEEVTALTKTDLKDAITDGYLHLTKTKGGIPRDVPITEQSKDVFRQILKEVPQEQLCRQEVDRGPGQTHKEAQKSIQNWIYDHRHQFDHKPSLQREKLTFHSFRHEYARRQYDDRIRQGRSEIQAKLEVSRLLGHGRDEVTRVYLGEVK